MTALLAREAALEYAGAGFRVFPLTAGAKTPLRGSHGVLDAADDPERLRRWWPSPNANIGIATGPGSGLWVLDADRRHGGVESLQALAAEHGGLPATALVKTPGGFHLYWRWPGGAEIRNSAGKIGCGIDVRGEGGYVVAPPSSLDTGGGYKWRRPAGVTCPPRREILPAPAWLVDLVAAPPARQFAAPIIGTIAEGQRNVALTSLAGTVRGRGCEEAEILALLLAANAKRCDPPLPERKVRAIARSVMRYPPDAAWWAAGGAEDAAAEEWAEAQGEAFAEWMGAGDG